MVNKRGNGEDRCVAAFEQGCTGRLSVKRSSCNRQELMQIPQSRLGMAQLCTSR
jgi:hypothetical protein